MPKYTVHCHMEEKFHGELEVEASSPREAQEIVEKIADEHGVGSDEEDVFVAHGFNWDYYGTEFEVKEIL